MSPETRRVLETLERMATLATVRIEGDAEEVARDAVGTLRRIQVNLEELARVLGADDVVDFLERDEERRRLELWGHGYRERWDRQARTARSLDREQEAVGEKLDRWSSLDMEARAHG